MRQTRRLLISTLLAALAAVMTLYAAASFPTAVKSFTTHSSGDTIQASHINDLQDEVVAIETALLTGPHPPLVFPSTQDASADPNTLDDYEEGTFTPTIGGSTSESGQAYSVQVGRYVKVGKWVHVQGRVTLSTLGTITGNVRIKGLPFTAANVTNAHASASIGAFANLTTSVVSLTGVVVPNTTDLELRMLTAAAASMSTMAQANLSATTDLIFTASYEAEQ